MIGTPNIMKLRTIVGAPIPQAPRTDQVVPMQPTGTVPENRTPFPTPRAAIGPDYSIGDPYYPVWRQSSLRAEFVAIIPSNYGQRGGEIFFANNGMIGDPQTAGSTELATNKIRSVRWDPEALPGFDPTLPAWNNLPPGSYYGGKISSVKGHANYGTSAAKQSIAGPLQYNPPGVASLIASGLNGS